HHRGRRRHPVHCAGGSAPDLQPQPACRLVVAEETRSWLSLLATLRSLLFEAVKPGKGRSKIGKLGRFAEPLEGGHVIQTDRLAVNPGVEAMVSLAQQQPAVLIGDVD